MNFVLFDATKRDNLLPITYTRPIATIRIGMLTLKEKWEYYLKKQTSYLVPDYLSEKFTLKTTENNIYINAAVIPSTDLINAIAELNEGEKLIFNKQLIAFSSSPLIWKNIENGTNKFKEKTYPNDLKIIKNTWDIIAFLPDELSRDFARHKSKNKNYEFSTCLSVLHPENITIGQNVKLGACILNASDGEIIIDDNAVINDGAIIKGPVYVGKYSTVNMGAKIQGPVSIGNNCKVGGEVCNSVFQAYCNKGHDGFLGHSYLGEWCNLGADTNNSNLKNTYDKVRIWNYASERFDKTGMQFLGMIMGDHAKTGINTMLNTGTVIGVSTNVYGAGFPRNFMPDFTNGGAQKMEVFHFKRAFKMAESMMARRNISFSEHDKKIFEYIFEHSKKYRNY